MTPKLFIDLHQMLARLKHTPLYAEVESKETAASRSHAMATLAFYHQDDIRQAGASPEHVMRLCLCHAVHRAFADTPDEPDEKTAEAVACFFEIYHAPQIADLFKEYRAGETPEAGIARNLALVAEEMSFGKERKKQPSFPSLKKASAAARFHKTLSTLKKLKRTGWVICGIKNPESVADHSFGVAMMALSLEGQIGSCADEALKMALIHDLSEVITGDIVPEAYQSLDKKQKTGQTISPKEKSMMETIAVQKIAKNSDFPEVADLWQKYERKDGAASRYVHDFDRLDLIRQAFEYIRKQPDAPLMETFWENNSPKLKTLFARDVAVKIGLQQTLFRAGRRKGRSRS